MKTRFLPLSLVLVGLAACQSTEPLVEETVPEPAVLHVADRDAYDALLAMEDSEVEA